MLLKKTNKFIFQAWINEIFYFICVMGYNAEEIKISISRPMGCHIGKRHMINRDQDGVNWWKNKFIKKTLVELFLQPNTLLTEQLVNLFPPLPRPYTNIYSSRTLSAVTFPLLKGLSSEISKAKSGINQFASVTGWGAEIFSWFCPSPLMWPAF